MKENQEYSTVQSAHSRQNKFMDQDSQQLPYKCVVCSETFSKKNDMNKHRITKHKTYRPCLNFKKGECIFGENCFYHHIDLPEDKFICYICGTVFSENNLLMIHRKNDHKTEICQEFSKGGCKGAG
jgi:DNA-directed RNA polymerase subunit RPC12/RpoP